MLDTILFVAREYTVNFLVWTVVLPFAPAVFMAGLAVGAFLFRA